MYSILPALVSLLFLGYGMYVLAAHGPSRVALAFFLVCVTTFCWQLMWAVLFQTSNPGTALALAKAGYLLILFLPTTLYHFVVELSASRGERRRVLASCMVAALLALGLPGDALVAGLESYFFGFYPKAGLLHPLHLLQTGAVMLRALYLLYRRQQLAVSTQRARLRYCLCSMLIYFFAAIDYLCNYGFEFYPPGVLFIAVSLGLIAQAMVRHQLLASPVVVAATIAHEMRTPLLTIRAQARSLARAMPELIDGYRLGRAGAGADGATLSAAQLAYLAQLGAHIETEVTRSNFIVDMMLVSARLEMLDRQAFALYSMKQCVADALARYPFDGAARASVAVRAHDDFIFYGCDILFAHVLYNLLKNALRAIALAGQGEIEIALHVAPGGNRLSVTDTGPGIAEHVLPHVFEPFYTTSQAGGGSGMGLDFCRRVLGAFGGSIRCESREGRYTTFWLAFPPARADA